MSSPAFVIAIVFSVFLGAWPLAFLVAIVSQAIKQRWRRVGQLALLLPVWCVAASIGLLQLPRLIAALDGTAPGGGKPALAAVAVGLALCLGALVWALLVQSFGKQAGSPR